MSWLNFVTAVTCMRKDLRIDIALNGSPRASRDARVLLDPCAEVSTGFTYVGVLPKIKESFYIRELKPSLNVAQSSVPLLLF